MGTKQVGTAVITAAGFGTRFLPISKAVPKEMLPLVDKPVIQYAVEQAVEAGITRVVLVTSRGKGMMEDYFGPHPELERTLEERQSPKLAELQRIASLAEVVSVRQQYPQGLGHAVLTAKPAVGDEPFVVLLPDEILLGSPSPTRQLLDASARLGGSVIGVGRVAREDVSRYGIASGEPVDERTLRLGRVVEKPPVAEAPSDLAIFGPYVFNPAIFDALEHIEPGAGGELQLTDAIALLAQSEPVFAHRFEGHRHDAGTPFGLLTTAVELALERPDYAPQVRAWLTALTGRLAGDTPPAAR
ncbi:MAG: UTP--glucose-1-phosphate uridylyltransferase [Chloroflexota bacterium]